MNENFPTNNGNQDENIPVNNENQVNIPETPAAPDAGAEVEATVALDPPAEPEAVAEVEPTVTIDPPAAPNANAEVAPKAPKKAPTGLIITGAIVALIAILTIVFWNPLSTFARKIFLSDSAYAKHIVTSTIEDELKTAKNNLDEALTYFEKGATADLEVSVNLTKDGKEYIKDFVDEEYIKWFDSAALDLSVAYKGNNASIEASGKLNKTDLVSAEITVADDAVYLAVPTYNKKAVFAEIPGGMPEFDFAPIIKAIDLDLIEKIALNYTNIILGATEAEEEVVEIKAGGVIGKLTESKIEIDGELAFNVMEAVLKEAQKDKDLKALFQQVEKIVAATADSFGDELYIDAEDFDAEDVYDEFIGEVEYALEELEYLDKDDLPEETMLEISIYSDSNGDFAGLKVYSPDYEETMFEVYYVTSGSKAGFELNVYEDEFTIVGEGKESGNKLTAEFTVSEYDYEILTFETKNLDLDKLNENIFKGELIFPIYGDLSVSVLSNSGNNEKIDLEVALVDGNKDLATIEVNGSVKTGAKISAPKGAVDTEDEDKLLEWTKETLKSVIKKLPKALKSADLPEEFLEIVEEGLEEAEYYLS